MKPVLPPIDSALAGNYDEADAMGENGAHGPNGGSQPPPVTAKPHHSRVAPASGSNGASDPGRTLPHSLEAEEYLLGACLVEEDEGKTLAAAREAGVQPTTFYADKHGVVFATLLRMAAAKKPIHVAVLAQELKDAGQLESVGGYAFIAQITSTAPTTARAAYFAAKVRDLATVREIIRAAQLSIEDAHNFVSDLPALTADLRRRLDFATSSVSGTQEGKVLEACYARGFNFAIIPPKPVPRFLINGTAVCTPGNITTLLGQSKTCKSTYQEAMIAAVIAAANGNAQDCDTLGIKATPPAGLHLVHIDTEQSIYDHDQLIRRALRRARADECPTWLHSFCVTGFAIPDCRRLVRLLLEDMQRLGGTYAMLIDGVADLAINVNDPEECNPLITELHEASIKFDCSIVCNIHENPGQDIGKGRGHLGSQLERKAESNLRLRKTFWGCVWVGFYEKRWSVGSK